MRVEKQDTVQVLEDIAELIEFLEIGCTSGELDGYDTESIRRHLKTLITEIYPDTLKEGDNVGGIVLETEVDRIYDSGISQGRVQGRAEGRVKALYYDAQFSIPEISQKTGMSEEKVTELLKS